MDKWTRLYDWLNDTRLAIAPDENMTNTARALREAAVSIVDATLEEMERLENEEGEVPNE